MPDESPKRIGPYEIVGKLGRGGMAVVYKAVQTSLNRTVAVKTLPPNLAASPESVERFHREAKAVAMLNHPNIVQIIDKDEADGFLYFVMEYVEGTSLDAVLHQRRLSFPEALRVFKEVCKGLEYAHQRQIVHRDLNPRNVLVSQDLTTVKLADFGICRVEALSRESGTLSTSEVSMGTLHYLAPEQAQNMLTSDYRSDIFSLGVLLYEMLTGTVPVGRFNLPSRLNQEVPPGIDPIVLKCLATDPKDRYRSVTELLAEIKRLEESLRLRLVDELKGISKSTGNIFRRSTQTFGKRNNLFALAALAIVVVLAGLGFAIYQTGWLSTLADSWRIAAVDDSGEAAPETAPEGASGTPADTAAEAANASASDQPPAAVSPAPKANEPAKRSPEAAPARTPTTPPSPKVFESQLAPIRETFQAGRYEPALAEIDTFLTDYPDGPGGAEGLLLKAQILAKAGRYPEQEKVCKEFLNRFGGNARQPEVQYLLAEAYRSQRNPGWETEAIRLFSEAAQGDASLAPGALARKGDVQAVMKLKVQDPTLGKEVPETLVTYRQLVTKYPTAPEAEFALWSLASMYRDLREDALAAATYESLGTNFPGSRWDAWWEAAELYDKELKDPEKAKAAYAKVPASSRNYDKAQKRLEKVR